MAALHLQREGRAYFHIDSMCYENFVDRNGLLFLSVLSNSYIGGGCLNLNSILYLRRETNTIKPTIYNYAY